MGNSKFNVSDASALFFPDFLSAQNMVRVIGGKIGHLQDGVILLLRPESFSFFFLYLNLVIPARFK